MEISIRSKMQQKKDQSEKKGSIQTQRSTMISREKKHYGQQNIGSRRSWHNNLIVKAEKKQKQNDHPLHYHFLRNNPESKYKKGRNIALTQRKKVEVIGSLAKKFKVSIAVAKNKARRKKNELSQEEREWLKKFLEREDKTYITPGRRNTVYVGMDHDKRQYKQKRYLLWKIRDLLGVINASKVLTNKQYASFPETF